MRNILDIIYRGSLAIFEFVIDLLIIFVSIVILRAMFGNNIYTNSLILLISFCGLVYGIRDAIDVYNKIN